MGSRQRRAWVHFLLDSLAFYDFWFSFFNMKAEHSKTHERISLLPSHFVKFLAWKYRFSISYARTKMKVNFNGVSLLCQTLILCWINFSRFTLEFIFFYIATFIWFHIRPGYCLKQVKVKLIFSFHWNLVDLLSFWHPDKVKLRLSVTQFLML